MKKTIILITLLSMLMSLPCYAAQSTATKKTNMDSSINVMYNNKKIEFTDAVPIIYNSRTLVPLRAVFEAMGAAISWNDSTKTAVIKKDDTTIRITIGDNIMYINNMVKILDVPALINRSSRTLLPLRAVSEGLGSTVNWNEKTQTVEISD